MEFYQLETANLLKQYLIRQVKATFGKYDMPLHQPFTAAETMVTKSKLLTHRDGSLIPGEFKFFLDLLRRKTAIIFILNIFALGTIFKTGAAIIFEEVPTPMLDTV